MSGTNLILLLLIPLNLAISTAAKLLRAKGKLEALVPRSQERRGQLAQESAQAISLCWGQGLSVLVKTQDNAALPCSQSTLASALKMSSTQSHLKKWFDEYQSAELQTVPVATSGEKLEHSLTVETTLSVSMQQLARSTYILDFWPQPLEVL